jgi:hypothetical protein
MPNPRTPNETIRAPVFIVGAPRSGTTLLRVTLNRHPQLAICGETAYFRRVYARRDAFGDPGNRPNRNRVVGAYLAIEPVRRLGMDIDVLRERLMSDGVTWRALFASLLHVYADSQGKPHSGEKTPGHALYVKTLCDWFPDCTIIHLVRDPRAAVYSLTQVPWASRSVLMGARTWRLFNTAARAVSARDNYLLVKYEDLVTRTEEQLRRMCEHIGLEYQPAMLEPNPAEFDSRQPVHRAYERITAARVALWREKLEPWQVSAIEAAAGHQMEQFGYERQTEGATTSMARATAEALVEMTFQKFFRSPSAFYHFLQPTNLADEEKWLARASAIYGRFRLSPPTGGHRA